jgi:long-chain acyl-CoA synthetase
VGKPLPGIHLRLTDDGEILVKGPNVMMGYYKNYEANKDAFTNDFWFRTGDVGEFTESGVKLLSRKDRIFKLSNGEKVIPSEVELMIHEKCHYISYVLVEGNGREYPVALLFPNKKLLHHPDYSNSPMQGCFCPRSLDELRKCLTGCLNDANTGIKQKFSKIRYASIINGELTVEDGTLTPSLKIAPRNVLGMYKDHLENLYGGEYDGRDEVYVVELTHPFNATDYA